MPPKPPAQQMGELHEVYLADVNDGRKSRGSGSQWDDQADGRNRHDGPFAFCWDGKSTRGQQIAVTLAMIAKIREQAQGERPQLGLRWYGNDLLDKITEDWVAVQAEDWREVLAAARRLAVLEAGHGDLSRLLEAPILVVRPPEGVTGEEAEAWGAALEAIVRAGHLPEVVSAGEEPGLVAGLRAEIDQLRDEAATMKTAAETANSRWADAMNGSKRLREEVSGLRDNLATRDTELEAANSKVGVMARALQGDGSSMAAAARSQAAMVVDLEEATRLLTAAGEELARTRDELDRYRAGRVIPPYVPHLPWTLVFQVHMPDAGDSPGRKYDVEGNLKPFPASSGRSRTTGMRYDAGGAMTPFEVSSIRIERSMRNRPRLIVNDTLVTDGDLYVDGQLRARAWSGNPAGETG